MVWTWWLSSFQAVRNGQEGKDVPICDPRESFSGAVAYVCRWSLLAVVSKRLALNWNLTACYQQTTPTSARSLLSALGQQFPRHESLARCIHYLVHLYPVLLALNSWGHPGQMPSAKTCAVWTRLHSYQPIWVPGAKYPRTRAGSLLISCKGQVWGGVRAGGDEPCPVLPPCSVLLLLGIQDPE